MSNAELATISLCIILGFAQFYASKFELSSDFFIRGIHYRGDWGIHHDEKMCLSDARYWYLKRSNPDLSIRDYLPHPISAGFGIMTPLLIYLGFNIFGLNNRGLRFFTIILLSASNIFIVSVLFQIAEPYIAIAASIIYILNWNNFILTMRPTPESHFTFYLTGIIFLFICLPDLYRQHWAIISFLSGSSILLKINFPIQLLFFLLSFNTLAFDLTTLLPTTCYFLLGLLSFELIQFISLRAMGIAKDRYFNLFMVSQVHTGRQGQVLILWDKIFYVFTDVFLEWFGIYRHIYNLNSPKRYLFPGSILLMGGILWCLLFFSGNILWPLPIVIALCLLSVAPFHFCLKRVISIAPIAFVTVIGAVESFITLIPDARIFVIAVFLLITVISVFRQYHLALKEIGRSSDSIKRFSLDIDNLLPEGSEIYCHLFAFRAAWQIKKHRLFVCDDGVMVNQEIFDWAVNKGAKYVLLTLKGGGLSIERWQLLKPVRLLSVNPTEVDSIDTVVLYEITL